MIKVLELFGGIGACSKALKRLGVEYEIADYVEIDKYAVKSFNAMHGTNFEPQDIKEWDKDIECDLIMHGSPCQDFSVAGKGAGGDEGSGTRSSLMYETLRIVEKLKPKYVIWENVKNLLSKKHRHNFDTYIEAMSELGYESKYQVLNAKDYGVPQNRERVFTVSIRNDLADSFIFPEKQPLTKTLANLLEKNVDERYYLSDRQAEGMMATSFNSYSMKALLKDEDDVANCLKARFEGTPQLVSTGGTKIQRKVCNEAIRKGLVKPNDIIEYTYSRARLEEIKMGKIKIQNRLHNDCSSTIKTNSDRLGLCVRGASRGGSKDWIRIRKLTPKECWRLMGFDDSDFKKAEKVNSNTQLYKQAGNSIVVNVLEAILSNLLGNQ